MQTRGARISNDMSFCTSKEVLHTGTIWCFRGCSSLIWLLAIISAYVTFYILFCSIFQTIGNGAKSV